MLKLPNNPLADIARTSLNEWQNEINELATYELKVETAKERFPIKRNLAVFRHVVEALTQGAPGAERCAYCEDSLGNQVEHIAPKEFFPERVFEFNNYLMACNPCNSPKWTKFAVFPTGSDVPVALTRNKNYPIEQPPAGDAVLINPRFEDAWDYLELDLFGTGEFLIRDNLSNRDRQRAEYTLSLLNLNKPVLLRARKAAITSFKALLESYDLRKSQHFDDAELRRLIEGMLNSPHPTVLEQIRRFADLIDGIADIFRRNPELNHIFWFDPPLPEVA